MSSTPFQTKENEARAEWEAQRLHSIGGSEAYELLNEAQYGRGCRTALAYRKLNTPPDYDDFTEEDAALYKRGSVLEPIVAALYSSATGRALRRPPSNDSGYPIPRRHPQYPWATVNTDRTILIGRNARTVGDLEIKTRDQGPFLRVKRLGPFAGDELQMQWSMFVSGHEWGALAVLGVFGGLPLIQFDRERDTTMHQLFIRRGEEFAEKVWGQGKVPEPEFDASDQRCKVCVYRMTCRGQEIDKDEAEALRQVKASSRKLVQIDDPMLATTLAELDILGQEEKALKQTMKSAKEEVDFRLDGVEAALVHGYGRVTKVEVSPRVVSYEADGYSYYRRTPTKVA